MSVPKATYVNPDPGYKERRDARNGALRSLRQTASQSLTVWQDAITPTSHPELKSVPWKRANMAPCHDDPEGELDAHFQWVQSQGRQGHRGHLSSMTIDSENPDFAYNIWTYLDASGSYWSDVEMGNAELNHTLCNGTRFSKVEFSRSIWSHCAMGAEFDQCEFQKGLIQDSDASYSSWDGSRLTGTRMVRTDLTLANFWESSGDHVHVVQSLANGVNWDQAWWDHSLFLDTPVMASRLSGDFSSSVWIRSDWTQCDASDGSFPHASMARMVMRDSFAYGANFRRADLRGAEVINTPLTWSHFCHLQGNGLRAVAVQADHTCWNHAVLSDAIFDQGSFRYAQFKGVQWDGVSFVGADLTGADLRDSSLDQVDFTQANLTNVIVDSAGFRVLEKVLTPAMLETLHVCDGAVSAELLRAWLPARRTVQPGVARIWTTFNLRGPLPFPEASKCSGRVVRLRHIPEGVVKSDLVN